MAAGLLAAALSNRGAPAAAGNATAAPGGAAAEVVAYARAQVGKPYLWGAAGPGAFDCSGLGMAAYGIAIPRTSQQQWASAPRVARPQPGDLVFFPGALQPGESPPGHVGVVVDPARHLMIDAYGTGAGVEYDTYGLASSKPGLSRPWGFTDPAWGP